MPRLLTLGGMIVDNVVASDGRVSLGRMGGNAAYAAVGARLWHDDVGVVAHVPDAYPDTWLERLRAAGVATDGVGRHPETVALAEWFFYRPDGSRTDQLHSAPDALAAAGFPSDRLTPEQAREWETQLRRTPPEGATFASFRAAHPVTRNDLPHDLDDIWAAHLAPERLASHLELARALKDAGALVTLDPGGYVTDLRPRNLTALLEPLDAFLPSEKELAALFPGHTPEAALASLAGEFDGVALVKQGAAGSLVWDRDRQEAVRVPAVAIRALDPTGAGDAFCGGFLAGLAASGDPLRAARCGTVAASFAVEGFGALHALDAPRNARDARLRELEALSRSAAPRSGVP